MLTIDHFGLTEDEILDWCSTLTEAYRPTTISDGWYSVYKFENGKLMKCMTQIIEQPLSKEDALFLASLHPNHINSLLAQITNKPYYQKCKDVFAAYLLAGKNNEP